MVVQHGEDRGIVVGDHEAGTVESLGLVNEHVAAFVVGIVGHHHTARHGVGGTVLCMQELQQLGGLGAWGSAHV